jgi:hypothetical protein
MVFAEYTMNHSKFDEADKSAAEFVKKYGQYMASISLAKGSSLRL